MSVRDDAKRLSLRNAERVEDGKRLGLAPTTGAACLLARTKLIQSYPVASATFFACESQSVTGTEVEGGVANLTSDGNTYFAFNLGTAVPPQGTPVLTTFIGNRWVFRYDG